MSQSKGDSRVHLIYLVSDGTGETAEKAVRAVLTQYPSIKTKVNRFQMVRTREQVESIVTEAKTRDAIVVFTMVIQNLKKILIDEIRKHDVNYIDLLGAMMDRFSQFFHDQPEEHAGALHQVNDEYFKRIEAIEFTVKHDDGNLLENLRQADIILVGVSRTSKTPLSIYLSHKGYKVANVPLVRGIEPPKELDEIDPRKVIGLTINPEVLSGIRRERLVRLGRDAGGDYSSLSYVQDEVSWAQQVFHRHRKWVVLDVTNKALEETAADIERRFSNRLSLGDLLSQTHRPTLAVPKAGRSNSSGSQ